MWGGGLGFLADFWKIGGCPDKHSCCELFFPLQSPGSPWSGNPRKMGKNYKIPPPPPRSSPRKWRKITEKLQKKCIFRVFVGNFSVIFLHFRGLDRGGEFCNFSPIFRGFPLQGLPGKTTRNTSAQSFLAKLPQGLKELSQAQQALGKCGSNTSQLTALTEVITELVSGVAPANQTKQRAKTKSS